MAVPQQRQLESEIRRFKMSPRGREAVVPNPKAKLLDQVREVMRVRHYSIRTERTYCEWIRRYIRFHGMRTREELSPGTGKVELFLSGHAEEQRQTAFFTAEHTVNALLCGVLSVIQNPGSDDTVSTTFHL